MSHILQASIWHDMALPTFSHCYWVVSYAVFRCSSSTSCSSATACSLHAHVEWFSALSFSIFDLLRLLHFLASWQTFLQLGSRHVSAFFIVLFHCELTTVKLLEWSSILFCPISGLGFFRSNSASVLQDKLVLS